MIKLELKVLEDLLPEDLVADWELDRAHAPDSLLDYLKAALERLQNTARFISPTLNGSLVAQGHGKDPITIQVMLCSRSSIDALSDCEGALGVHLVSNHDVDPFGDDAAFARTHRVLIVSDTDEFLALTGSLACEDVNPERYLDEYLEAYLNTVFHEIGHALLFAENAALMSPAEVDVLSDAGELDNDVFDCSTGYGIRPLQVNGALVWADDIDEATELMEIHVENLGREMMREVLTDHLAIGHFPRAMDAEDGIRRILKQ